MALKALRLQEKLRKKRTELRKLREKEKGFAKRESTLLEEVEEAATAAAQAAVEEEIAALEEEQEEVAQEIADLTAEIEEIKEELAALEDNDPASGSEGEAGARAKGGNRSVNTRTKFFGMSAFERDAFLAQEDVARFLSQVRAAGKQGRSVTNAELTIPNVMLELVRENILKYSKLLSYVRLRTVPGQARQNIMGTVPEAVWTEMCATLNELTLSFNNVEVDGFKVGGFIAICNATLQDSAENLASEIISALGQSIGIALDKAILYGKGMKMPLGIMTRLAQTGKPSDYPATSRDWEDLHTKNIISITAANSVGIKLYQAIIKAAGAARGTHSAGSKVWVMNDKTKAVMTAEALAFNAAGAIVSGIDNTMPVIGGDIVELDFVPDNVIIGGYGDCYLLAERAGTSVAQSEHVRFIEDQTVFRGTARYDGMPVIAEAFVAIGISGATPNASMDFAEDKANEPDDETP